MATKVYASFDIEADGAVPVLHNMLSLGISFHDSEGNKLKEFQRNIKPLPGRQAEKKCMEEFWDKNPEAWKSATSNQCEAKDVISDLVKILQEFQQSKCNVTWIAAPASFDWQWLKNYYEMFKSETDPELGFSARCISTLFWTYCQVNGVLSKDDQAKLRKELTVGHTHTHKSLDDATEQASLFFGLCKLMNINLK
jgi:DNA polymerase III alpha subunit (gram-positive type)